VRIEGTDCAGLERLLRYCARLGKIQRAGLGSFKRAPTHYAIKRLKMGTDQSEKAGQSHKTLLLQH